MPSLIARCAAALTTFAAAALLSSCGSSASDNHARPMRSDEKPVISGEPAGSNTTDMNFANNVTALEEQAITMTRLVPDHSDDSGVVTLATNSGAALQVDTQVLKALRAQWKEGQDNRTAGGGPGTTPPGMIDDATIARLDSLHGPDFDALWLTSMIGLDQGVIELANTEVAGGSNVDAVSLAKQVAKARQVEITQMQELQGR